jgi:hypothetical protein
MIPVYRGDVSVVPLGGLKFLKWSFPLKFVKRIELAVIRITLQMISVSSADHSFCSPSV